MKYGLYYLHLQGVVQFSPLRRLVLNIAIELKVVGAGFQLEDGGAGGLEAQLTREVGVCRTGGDPAVSLHLLLSHPVLQFALLDQHFPPGKSCVESSHLLLIIEEAHAEQAQRHQDADQDNHQDDGVLLAVQICTGKEKYRLFTDFLFDNLHHLLSRTFLGILLDNP